MNVRKLIQRRSRSGGRPDELFADATAAMAATGDAGHEAAATTRGDELTDDTPDEAVADEPEAGAELTGADTLSLAHGGIPLNAAVAADAGDEATADSRQRDGDDAK